MNGVTEDKEDEKDEQPKEVEPPKNVEPPKDVEPTAPSADDHKEEEKGKPEKKRKAPKTTTQQEPDHAASDHAPPAKKKRVPKAEKQETGSTKSPARVGCKKPNVSKGGDGKDAGEDEAVEKPAKKRTRYEETQTFARRNVPSTEFGKNKWFALRSAFSDQIRPKLKHFSAHEDFWFLNVFDVLFSKLQVFKSFSCFQPDHAKIIQNHRHVQRCCPQFLSLRHGCFIQNTCAYHHASV